MTGLPGYAGPQPAPGHFALSQAQLDEFVHGVTQAIGTTGDARRKLGFTVGPLCFDMSDEETRRFIRDAFAVAREDDVAVAFHIDDSISWGQRWDLLSKPDNIETADWKQIPNTGRRADWGPKPTRFPPQMCFNSPGIVAAVKDRAALIGGEIKHELAALAAQGKEHLFAGVIAGWETSIGRDFETGRRLGYRALSHRGFSESHPPQDPDRQRVQVVQEFMELWAGTLHTAGIPRERIFCHIAFTSQGLRAADAQESYAQKVHFALPEVAFSSAYRPGFSTYPEGGTLKEIQAVLAQHGSPGWISAEGTNVSPTSMPGEPTMETYLGRMFNHGAVMVNVFSWGVGGEAMRDNFFRRATENPEALAAYGKFLRHIPLVETAPTGFSSEAFQAKMRRIQAELPGWVQKSGQQVQAMSLTEKLKASIGAKKWQAADQVADELLALMNENGPTSAKPDALPLAERLPPKIHKIQERVDNWLHETGRQDKAAGLKAIGLMKKLQEQMQAKDYEEAEKSADAILQMMSVAPQSASRDISAEALKKLRHDVGGSFIVSRDKVQEDLQLTAEQKEKVLQRLGELAPDAVRFLQKIQGLEPEDRKQQLMVYRRQAQTKLAAWLPDILNADQRARLRQIELQREGLRGAQVWDDLHVTPEQRSQFKVLIQQAQRETQLLMEDLRKGGARQEIQSQVIKVREDLEGKLQALLTDAQKKQWQDMLGKPMALADLFDL